MARIGAVYGDATERKKPLESWYDGVMDRASGWSKRRTQRWLIWFGLVAAIGFNINAIEIARHLATSDETRAALVRLAARTVEQNGEPGQAGTAEEAEEGGGGSGDLAAPGTPLLTAPPVAACKAGSASEGGIQAIIACREAMRQVGLPIGWSGPAVQQIFPHRGEAWFPGANLPSLLVALVGWGVTAIAGTLGAPFWFDLLNKVMVVRATVKPKEKSGDEGSEDRTPRRSNQDRGESDTGADPTRSAVRSPPSGPMVF